MSNNKGTGMSVKPFNFKGAAGDAGEACDHNHHENGDDSMCPSEMERVKKLADMPESVRRRVAALRKLQIDTLNAEAEFYREVHALEITYLTKFDKIQSKRSEIVNGVSEPTNEDAKFPLFSDSDAELAEQLKKTLIAEGEQGGQTTKTDVKGVPDFWLTVLKNVEVTSDMVQTVDEPILKHLTDIKVTMANDPMSFTLHFLFSSNPYFTNAELTKRYILKCAPELSHPADFDGPEIIKCEGCAIDWQADKNVTVKLVKKKQKNKKQAGATRFVTKQVKADSFFNFFDPPEHKGVDNEELDDNDQMLLHMDFELGHTIRDQVVPHALFHFTGEADEDDDEDDEFDEDEEEDEDDDGSGDDEE